MTTVETIILVVFIVLCILNYTSNKLTKENNKLHKELMEKLDATNELRRKIYYK